MEAAKKMADALQAGQIGPEFPVPQELKNLGKTPQDWAKELGDTCHTWRNYFALGAIGPDLFFLLPDFHGAYGAVLLTVVQWVRDVYEPFDSQFLEAWKKYAQPVEDAGGDIANQLSGQMLNELQGVYNSLGQAIQNAVLDVLSQMWDWFGFFTSGVPQGFADNAFFWSDMFHYRKTYEFAQRLWTNAASSPNDGLKAYALGWMSHCATDVTGHSFVNSKCGGPYRTHWQRHHLIENHMDARAYDAQHGGVEPYGEFDTSAMHFRIAFRKGLLDPYINRDDAPAYDYFSGFPSYPLGDNPTDRAVRDAFFDLDTNDLPDDLARLLIDSMHQVWRGGNARAGVGGPKVLFDVDPTYRDGDTGVPSAEVIKNTFWTLYHYLKFTTTSGYSPPRPTRPPLVGDKRPPPWPGFSNVVDDPARGGDEHNLSLADILLALLAWPIYLAELGVWLATVLPGTVADLATYPARESLYEFVVVPAYSAYLASRRPLVMAGFLMPKHEEVARGLIELGVTTDYALVDLKAALDSPDGTGQAPLPFDEPSGRANPGDPYGTDVEFPRDVVSDDPTLITKTLRGILGNSSLFCGRPNQPSEFLKPWAYPVTNQAGVPVGGERLPTHPGPWLRGDTALDLLQPSPGNAAARADFERASSPAETESQSDAHLKVGEHLGNPVDYGLYVVGQLTTASDPDTPVLPDFNLDSDRGYAYLCWDWNRRVASLAKRSTGSGQSVDAGWRYETYNPTFAGSVLGEPADRFGLIVPCTPPQGYCQLDEQGNPVNAYDPSKPLDIHYLDAAGYDPGCLPVAPVDVTPAGGRTIGGTPPPTHGPIRGRPGPGPSRRPVSTPTVPVKAPASMPPDTSRLPPTRGSRTQS